MAPWDSGTGTTRAAGLSLPLFNTSLGLGVWSPDSTCSRLFSADCEQTGSGSIVHSHSLQGFQKVPRLMSEWGTSDTVPWAPDAPGQQFLLGSSGPLQPLEP